MNNYDKFKINVLKSSKDLNGEVGPLSTEGLTHEKKFIKKYLPEVQDLKVLYTESRKDEDKSSKYSSMEEVLLKRKSEMEG